MVVVSFFSISPSLFSPPLPQLEIVSVENGLVTPLLVCNVYLPFCLSQEYFLNCFISTSTTFLLNLVYTLLVTSPWHLLVFPLQPVPSVRCFLLLSIPAQSCSIKLLIFQPILRVISWTWFCRVLTAWLRLILIFLPVSHLRVYYFLYLLFLLLRNLLRTPFSLFSFNFKQTNFMELSAFLLDFDFGPLFSSDIEFVWFFLKSVILHSITLFTTRVKNKSRSSPFWFNSSIHHQLKYISFCCRNAVKGILLLLILCDFPLLNFNSTTTF